MVTGCAILVTRPLQERSATSLGVVMSGSDDFTQLDDPAFLSERARVRETIEALIVRMRALDAEFVRRAGVQWKEEIQ